MKKLALGIALVSLLAACGIKSPFNRPVTPAPITTIQPTEPETPTPLPDVTTDAISSAPVAAEALASADAAPQAEASSSVPATDDKSDPLNDPASPLAKRSVFFPFDVDAIQESDKATIEAHGAYLASHADRSVRVEGNADERGSSEYNLALGQRRANQAKKALGLAGAKAEQVEAISFGEEKPLANGHDEASWAQNRRADIVYK